MVKKLTSKFFERSPIEVAKDLLGKRLIRKVGNKRYAGIIVETGAYSGMPTKKFTRYDGMLQEPGRIHIFNYRGNCSLNISTEKVNKPSVIHISKLVPTEGIDSLIKGKNISERCAYHLTEGPGKLTKAFKIDDRYDGKMINGNELWIEDWIDDKMLSARIEEVDREGLAEICLGYYQVKTN